MGGMIRGYRAWARGVLAVCVGLGAVQAGASVTTFENGIEGWGVFFENDGVLGDFLEPTGGNPNEHLRWTMIDTFGMTFHNATNADTIGDFSRFSAGVELGIDVKVDDISFFGSQVARNLIVELVDYNDDPGNPYPWTSVWFNLGEISRRETRNWTHFSITIDDPTAIELPAGWGGTGDEDPVTFEPILPADRTFASVLANVEEIRFTTFEPGFFYGFTNFQVRMDNPSVTGIPEPGTALGLAMLLAGGFAARRRG